MDRSQFMTPNEFRALREHHRLSQARLAELIHVDIGTIGRWERAERQIPGPVQVLMSLIDTLKPVRSLFGIPD